MVASDRVAGGVPLRGTRHDVSDGTRRIFCFMFVVHFPTNSNRFRLGVDRLVVPRLGR